jgi:hypothetical protein
VKHLVQRGLVLLGASAISRGLAGPALAGSPEAAPSNPVVQRQSVDVSNRTEQKAVAFAPAVQVAPALNVGVLSFGGQSIKQANSNSGNAQAGNWSSTTQSVAQRQSAAAAGSHWKHSGKSAKHDRKLGKHDRKSGRHPHKPGRSVSQRQSADVSNRTEQKAVAFAPAVQVAPALNVGVLSFGGQSIRQANSNSGNAGASNVNSTNQGVSQSQLGDA